MNKFAKIAEGLASWLNFELRAGREDLFSESYLAQPLGQLIQYRYKGRVRSEIEHPVLIVLMRGKSRFCNKRI